MSSRQEEKERRRQERMAAEKAEAAAAARRRRLGMVGATVLSVAAIAAVGIAIAAAGGGGDGGGDGGSMGSTTDEPEVAAVPIPERREADLQRAAKAAGCEAKSEPNYGRDHTDQPVRYRTNPPSSGDHHPVPAHDGVYNPGDEPDVKHLVHAMEHGRIIVWYKPGLPERARGQLQSLFNERAQYMLLLENKTGMPSEVAATSWQQALRCPKFNDRVFDAIRAFRDKYTLQAPEPIAQPE